MEGYFSNTNGIYVKKLRSHTKWIKDKKHKKGVEGTLLLFSPSPPNRLTSPTPPALSNRNVLIRDQIK